MKKRALTVRVTSEAIELGLSNHNSVCGVAVAMRTAFPQLGWVSVTRDEIKFTNRDDGIRYTFKAPASVTRFVDAYDMDREAVRPFTFTLDLDKPVEAKPKRNVSPRESVQRNKPRDTPPKKRGNGVPRTRRDPFGVKA